MSRCLGRIRVTMVITDRCLFAIVFMIYRSLTGTPWTLSQC